MYRSTYEKLTDYQITTINSALQILESTLKISDQEFNHANAAKNYFRLKIGHYAQEVFAVAFLNQKHQLISFEEMFSGTISQSAVYPREIAKRGLALNAAAIILSHNHPSGNTQPSSSDQQITHKITEALKYLEIRVLDHVIVSQHSAYSFAEYDLL